MAYTFDADGFTTLILQFIDKNVKKFDDIALCWEGMNRHMDDVNRYFDPFIKNQRTMFEQKVLFGLKKMKKNAS